MVLPSEDQTRSLIHEHISMLRMALTGERQDGEGDLWFQTYGLFENLTGDSAQELLQKLANEAIARIMAGAAVGGQLAVAVANLRNEDLMQVLDNLELTMIPQPDDSTS